MIRISYDIIVNSNYRINQIEIVFTKNKNDIIVYFDLN